MAKKVPITRLGKFFDGDDYNLDIEMGEEWLSGDMNFTLALFKIDRQRTKIDDVYGEVLEDGIQFLPPIEFKAYVHVQQPENKFIGTSKVVQTEPGNLKFSVYIKQLVEMNVDINVGDYIGYYETEDFVRYYSVVNDGRIVSDNKHTYGGYKPFYRTYVASPVNNNEFKGI
jgi:hypothetical protein